MHNPFRKPRIPAKRSTPRRVKGRVRLHGDEMEELRRQVFERSGKKCEEMILVAPPVGSGLMMTSTRRCNASITWDTMHVHILLILNRVTTPPPAKCPSAGSYVRPQRCRSGRKYDALYNFGFSLFLFGIHHAR